MKPKQKLFKRKRGINRLGKVGKTNLEANRRLRERFRGTTECEMRLEGCLVSWPLQFAHRHKRSWYRGNVETLSNHNQVVVACQSCHEKTEHNRLLNDKVFWALRGSE